MLRDRPDLPMSCCLLLGKRHETIGRGGGWMKVRPGAVVRGAGVTLACLVPDASKRSPILFTGFAVGWFLNRPGLQIFTVIPDEGDRRPLGRKLRRAGMG